MWVDIHVYLRTHNISYRYTADDVLRICIVFRVYRKLCCSWLSRWFSFRSRFVDNAYSWWAIYDILLSGKFYLRVLYGFQNVFVDFGAIRTSENPIKWAIYDISWCNGRNIKIKVCLLANAMTRNVKRQIVKILIWLSVIILGHRL